MLVRSALNEAASGDSDAIMQALKQVDDRINDAFLHAGSPRAKAILMGLHQDLFNMSGEFRKHLRQI